MAYPTQSVMSLSTKEFQSVPLFRSVSMLDVQDLLPNCSLLRVDAGRVVMAAGQPNERMYVLLRGEVSIRIESPDSPPVATLPQGEVFGELSAIDGQPASAFVVTETECRLLGLRRDALWELFRRTPYVARNLLSILTRRIRNNNELIADYQRQVTEKG